MEIPYYDISLLYVEDDALARENVGHLQKRLVAKLQVAGNGQEGLDLFRTHNPEIVVTDIMVTGYIPYEVIGKMPSILKSGATPPELYEDLWQTERADKEWEGELANLKKDGQVYWEWMRICPLRNGDGTIIRFLKVCQDITERKNYEAMLRYISMHDPLTGLYNRAYFDA